MELIQLVLWNLVVRCSGFIMDLNDTGADHKTFLENSGYPKPGDIPVLNRKYLTMLCEPVCSYSEHFYDCQLAQGVRDLKPVLQKSNIHRWLHVCTLPKLAAFQHIASSAENTCQICQVKVFRGQRVTIGEHPYIVSIRRRHAHYLVGTLLTKSVVITVAHPLHNVSPTELNVVVGESYCDRGTFLATVLLVIIHQHFDPYTLRSDIAMIRFFEDTNYRFAVKAIQLTSSNMFLNGHLAFLTGWGRCDNTGTELCLDRSSKYIPDEKIDPMLQSISFTMSISNYFCNGYRRHDITIPDGTLCVGPSREEDPVCPCLGVPGAPLVVSSRLVALLSWGFGCGYQHDLPLIYTNIQDNVKWILHNIVVMSKLKQSNLTQLFQATKAYLIAEWFLQTRVIPPNIQVRQDKSLEPLEIDVLLSSMHGTIYDVRDYISGGAFHSEKQNMYAAFADAEEKNLKLTVYKEDMESKMKLTSFLSNNSAYFDKWFPNSKI